MGFKYVLIPASVNEPMQELDYATDVEDLSKDTFREFLENYFRTLGGRVDRAVLLQQLKERTGVDLQEKHQAGEIKDEALNRLLEATSVEIFPVMLPTKETEWEGVSLYCDDKGVAKELEVNHRASGLIQACGFPAQTFRGDVFLGRIFDDQEDLWRRADMTLRECSTDASWVAKTKKQRENRSSGDLASIAGKVGVNNPAHINPSMMVESEPQGETDKYTWRQTSEEVEVTFKTDGLSKGDKKLVKATFTRQKLKVEVRGEVLIEGTLCGQVQADDCTWTLSDGVLQVTLSKAEPGTWAELLRG